MFSDTKQIRISIFLYSGCQNCEVTSCNFFMAEKCLKIDMSFNAAIFKCGEHTHAYTLPKKNKHQMQLNQIKKGKKNDFRSAKFASAAAF